MGLKCPRCTGGKFIAATTDGYFCSFCKFSVSFLGVKKLDLKPLTVLDQRALEDAITRFATAQALLDGYASNSSGLEVKDIL